MSEEASPTQSVATKISPLTRNIIFAAIGLLLIAIVIWGAGVRTELVRRAEIARSADALSEALEPALLASDYSKIGKILEDIARAAHYNSMSYADNTGLIVASTDVTRRGIKSEALRKAPLTAEVQKIKGRTVVRRAVILGGDTRFGNLEIVVD